MKSFTVLAVLFRHPSVNFLNPKLAGLAKAMGLHYAIAQVLRDKTTIRVKLVGQRGQGRPMTLDFTNAVGEEDALRSALGLAVETAAKLKQISGPSSVLDALAS